MKRKKTTSFGSRPQITTPWVRRDKPFRHTAKTQHHHYALRKYVLPVEAAKLYRHIANLSVVSGEAPQEPVVSKKTGPPDPSILDLHGLVTDH